jgi:cephalosporin hydroxylase
MLRIHHSFPRGLWLGYALEMNIVDFAYKVANRIGIAKTRGTKGFDVANDAVHALAAEAREGLPKIFFAHRGRETLKWAHYLDAYERHFASFRQTTVRVLEIGVLSGGSLDLWRDYFGPAATIAGVDIDRDCANRVTAPNIVRIGSQDDPDFLRGVVAEMGGLDIVIDDGSHIGRHQRASFDALFPLLSDGGLYAIEDLHTAYWPGHYEGGYRREGTAIGLVKQMIDDLHGWYHSRQRQTSARDEVGGMHVYDSLVIIEKRRKERPRHLHGG